MKAVKAHEVAPVACTKHCGLCLDTEVTENGSRSARSRVRDARRTLVASLLTGGQGLTMKAVKAHEVAPVACTKHCGLCLDTEATENG